MKFFVRLFPLLLASLLTACAHVKVEPIEVKPIHIIHDINIKVDKQLEDFFAFENQKSATQATTTATTLPTTAPAPSPTTTTASNER